MIQPKQNLRLVTALAANRAGEIFELDGYAAVGMAGSSLVPLTTGNTREMPHGGELMRLPDRFPIVFNPATETFETLYENPYEPGEAIFPVAAFNSPGYVVTYISAYAENAHAGFLPLFSYGAVGWFGDGFRTPVILVDDEPRQDLNQMKREKIVAGVRRMKKALPGNRLRAHLEKCALSYGCPAGKNFFLGRYEAPLPTSGSCNARCLGCLSLQQDGAIPCSQNRIGFTPTPEEIAGVALVHIQRVPEAVVSFGQGCEGDPLLAAHVIAPAIEKIRQATTEGTINLNTNGSQPRTLARLFEAGLDSVRISMNSFGRDGYMAYFRPNGYDFSDVVESVELAGARKKFISVNYLNMAGFTDTPEEAAALNAFLRDHPVSMIQWRNLNYDPIRYWGVMDTAASHGTPLGVETVLTRVKEDFPSLRNGYFNPPKESW
jgi:pyruvate-formate lyase-activating enzyme